MCGSGAEVQGSGFQIANSHFINNGYPATFAGGGGPWSDGLTVWMCNAAGPTRSSIHNNTFANNTDIDLVVGGGNGCDIYSNTIQNTAVHAFAGMHIGWFPGGGGDHSGISYFNNQISSLNNLMSFGLLVGFHPWNNTVNLVSAGSVSGNTVSGAVINLQIEADTTGTASGQVIVGAGLSGAQGNWTYKNGTTCSISTNYAVNPAHAGRISFDAGYFPLLYDNESCTPQ